MDKQYGFAIIIILLGFGLIQMSEAETFLTGIGFGTIIIGMLWLVYQIIRVLKNPKKKSKK